MVIQKISLVDLAIDRIKNYIKDQEYKPNDRFLSEKELVAKLQVSRTVVREALISLQTIGILTIKSGGGVYIAEPKLDSITDILKFHYDTYGIKLKELIETREIVEMGALRLIIENNTLADTTELTNLNESYYQAILEKDDPKPYDRLFHQALMKATDNSTYYLFSEIINEYFSFVCIDVKEKEEELLQAYAEHKSIIETIETGNLHEAQNKMKKHFEPIFKLVQQLKETPEDGADSIL